jgi:large subunit ribosomal protein L4
MKIDLYSQKGVKSTKKIDIKDEIFKYEVNQNLINQYIYIHLVNTRQGTRSTKGRGEVSGTGKKPWKNNKVAKARTGSLRTNIFRGGGVSHGPKPMRFELSMPLKMRRRALYSALSTKMNAKEIIFIDKLKFSEGKLTKQGLEFLSGFSLEGVKTLIVTEKKDDKLLNVFSNIDKIRLLSSNYINAYDILNYRKILFLKDSLENIPGYKDLK